MVTSDTRFRNRLLARLDGDDRARLAPHLEAIDLPKGFPIADPGAPIAHLYFFENGIGSVVARSPEGFKAEVGLVGREGYLPAAGLLEPGTTVHEVVMQVGGSGYRIAAETLAAILAETPSILALMARFGQYLGTQTAYTALSNAVHHVEERLARWLLMCHDRMDGDELALTHEYLSILLAVRRPSVTTALHVLEGERLIRATRGLITIRDREGLERFASDAYGVPEAEYARLIGPMR